MIIVTESSVKEVLLEDVPCGVIFKTGAGHSYVSLGDEGNPEQVCNVVRLGGYKCTLDCGLLVTIASRITIKY